MTCQLYLQFQMYSTLTTISQLKWKHSHHSKDEHTEDVRTLFTSNKIELGDGKEELGHWCEVCKYVTYFY